MRSTWPIYCLFGLSGPLSMIIPHLVSVVQSSVIAAVIQSCFVLGLTSSSSICSCVSICPSHVTVADSSAASISTCVKIKIFNATRYCDTMNFCVFVLLMTVTKFSHSKKDLLSTQIHHVIWGELCSCPCNAPECLTA